MELLKTIRKRSFLNEAAYIALNIVLAFAILATVWTVASPVPALLLVLLSKWRVLAVRPRYWIANILANLVDIVVGLSVVMVMYSVAVSYYSLALQVVLAILYAAWLIGLKPRSGQTAVAWQASAALATGTTVLFVLSPAIPISVLVLVMAGLGYISARHVLAQFEEDHLQFLTLVWAFVLAEFGWVFGHWVVGYSVPILEVRVPQASIIIMLVAFVSYRVYASLKHHGQVQAADVALPIALSASVALVLLLFFSTSTINIM